MHVGRKYQTITWIVISRFAERTDVCARGEVDLAVPTGEVARDEVQSVALQVGQGKILEACTGTAHDGGVIALERG